MFHIDSNVITDPISDEMTYGDNPFADPSAGTGATLAEALAWESIIYDRDPLGGSSSPYGA
jgi:hypothetical protein